MRKVESRHCRADLVTECMKKKKTLILSGDFRFRFSAENKCPFSFSAVNGISFSSEFSFTAENKKMLFGRPLVYITKRSWS